MFWNISLPLWLFLLMWIGCAALFIWFGFIHHKTEDKLSKAAYELKQLKAEKLALETERDGLEEDNAEMLHGYATMATMIEELHTQLASVHQQLERFEARFAIVNGRLSLYHQRLERLEQQPYRIQFMHSEQPASQNTDYTGPCGETNEEPYYNPYPEPPTELPSCIQQAEIEGLDEL